MATPRRKDDEGLDDIKGNNAGTRAQPCLDLASVPVGIMADVLSTALAAGHEPWKPLDTSKIPQFNPPIIESNQLEERIANFYRTVDLKRGHKRKADDHTIQQQQAPPQRRKYGPKIDRFELLQREIAPMIPHKKTNINGIGDENVGKQMLRGMGWQEGTGLGSQGTGRAEPIADAGQSDTVGIGSRPPGANSDVFSQYRSHLSSAHKAKYG
eukprot:CAMPEP_0197295880 /NCGR_PEP_ID=MMETSP0890-20130614/36793_1 /TAXON_ID=44058 ORGANISM="Aureoumbra lagunensis, Strain CCMP1510" /NCGR_SAMPLE_ID=MMETSP0890 /ASSEMBLY_ACC=CAM_ASM_000533 /LENGTH=211 /DNA_ID=CAMNT_0042772109 /DNA_START=233 /DNA_END=868 /DNA_ORIENTATION=+